MATNIFALSGKIALVTGASHGIGDKMVSGPVTGRVSSPSPKARSSLMTKAFALQCGPDNNRVNALLPGLTYTKFADALTSNEEVLNIWLKQMPLRRYAQPSEMVGTVHSLVFKASSFATGSCVTVDDGFLV